MAGTPERRPRTADRLHDMQPAWIAAATLCAFTGLALRVWLLRTRLGTIDIDEATVGLQAAQFRHGRLEVFFPTQQYGGTLETGLVALVTGLFGTGAIALKATAIALHALAALLCWQTARRLGADRWAALAAPGLLWVGSAAVVWQSTKERGFYGVGVVLAAAVLLLVVRLADEPTPRDVLQLGFVSGLALWTSPILAAAVIPPVAWLAVARPQLRRAGRAASIGALAGAAPWLVWNLRHGWASLTAPPNFDSGYVERLRDLAGRLPVLLGSSTPWEPDRSVLPAPVALVALVALVVLATRATQDRARGLVATAVVGYLVLQALNGLAVAVGPDPRYLYPLVPALAVASASALRGVPTRMRAPAVAVTLAGAAAVAVWGCVGMIGIANRPEPDLFLASPGLPQVVAYLEAEHRDAAMADASGQQLAYVSGGRIAAASYAVPRFEDLEARGGTTGLTTYVLRTGYFGGDDRRLERHLRAQGIGYTRTEIGAFTVFLLDRPVAPADVPLTRFGGRIRAAAATPPR